MVFPVVVAMSGIVRRKGRFALAGTDALLA
jgi:hypothetical protein